MLTIVATPIGNLKDITLRALEALQSCGGIICEDSRRASVLLNHYQIRQSLTVLNDYNEAESIEKILEQLRQGIHLCLISDAGTPLISDPGFKLVRECLRQNIPVDSLPGPSSILLSLTLSGLPPDKFFFVGYLPEKGLKRQETLQRLQAIDQEVAATFIVFVAPFKLKRTLEDMRQVLGDIRVTLARELTKLHQEVQEKRVGSWLDEYQTKKPKGEFILLFNLKPDVNARPASPNTLGAL